MATIEKYFALKEVFAPSIYYEGVIELGNSASPFVGNTIILNSKNVHGQNGYKALLEKNFFPKLGLNAQEFSQMFKHLGLNLRIGYDAETDQKKVHFSYSSFLFTYLVNFLDSEYKYDEVYEAYLNNFLYEKVSDEDFYNLVRNNLRERRKILQDILKNGQNSEYYDRVYEDSKTYITNRKNFKAVVQDALQECSNFLVQSRLYKNLFSQNIDWQELLNIIDYDKLCLLIADYIMQVALYAESINQPAILLNILEKYFQAVAKIRQETEYNPIITVEEYIKADKYQKKIVTVDDVYKKYQDYLAHHPEVVIKNLDMDRIQRILISSGYNQEEIKAFDPAKKANYEKLLNLLNIMEAKQTLFAEWTFMPKQNADSEKINLDSKESLAKSNISANELLRRFRLAKNFIANSNYRFIVYGKDKFLGYLGYIYPNGVVLLEKDFTIAKNKSDIIPEATYITNMQNFVELTKLPKLEIIKRLHNDPNFGKRLFHYADMDRWERNVKQIISGKDYSPETMNLIDFLVEKDQLKRKR